MFQNREGKRVPNATFRTRQDSEWVDVTTDDVFAGKTVGVFHCPSDTDEQPEVIDNASYNQANSSRISYDFYSVWWQPEFGPKLTRLRGRAPLTWDLEGGNTDSNSPNSAMRNHKTHKGGNVVFADGHAEWQPAEDWDKSNWPSPAAAHYHK